MGHFFSGFFSTKQHQRQSYHSEYAIHPEIPCRPDQAEATVNEFSQESAGTSTREKSLMFTMAMQQTPETQSRYTNTNIRTQHNFNPTANLASGAK